MSKHYFGTIERLKKMNQEPNILVVVVDALRTKNLGCYGYSRQTSPNIDTLAKDGVLFENAFSCTTNTDPSVTSIFSGKYTRSHGITRHGEKVMKEEIQRINNGETSLLPEILKPHGYTTLAVDWLGRWHKRGYDYYSGILKRSKRHRMAHWLLAKSWNTSKLLYSIVRRLIGRPSFFEDARTVTDTAINLLETICHKKFFLFAHYWDTHYPYGLPVHHLKYFQGNLDELTVNELLARYDAAISFVDSQIGRLMTVLEDMELLQQTFVILTSDHGESLTEHGIYFDHHGLYDVAIHVPLILKYEILGKNKRIGSLVQHVDIVPTILEVLGLRSQSYGFDGESILTLINNETEKLHSAIYAEEVHWEHKIAIRTSDYKYIYAPSPEDAICRRCGCVHGGMEELYNLKEDAEETQNIVQRKPKQAISLRRKLDKWVEFLENKRRHSVKDGLSSYAYKDREEKEIQKRLRELGYF